MLVETREVEMKLQRAPKARGRFLCVFAANQEIQAGGMRFQQVGGDMRADVTRRSGQEYRHVAPLVPVFMVSVPAASSSFNEKARGGRTSSGRPSISG